MQNQVSPSRLFTGYKTPYDCFEHSDLLKVTIRPSGEMTKAAERESPERTSRTRADPQRTTRAATRPYMIHAMHRSEEAFHGRELVRDKAVVRRTRQNPAAHTRAKPLALTPQRPPFLRSILTFNCEPFNRSNFNICC